MKTEAEELAERLEHAAEFTEADFDVCSAEDLRQAASLLRRQAEALKAIASECEGNREDCDCCFDVANDARAALSTMQEADDGQ